MAAFLNNCRFIPKAGGTADWVYSSAVGGCQSPTLAGAVDGRRYKFLAISLDLTQWEIAEGAYAAASATFARTTVLYNSSGTGTATGQSGAGSKITFAAAPNVAIVGVKEDLISIEEANSFTATQQGQARTNIGAFGRVNVQVFTASGTYVPSANLLFAIAEGVGGGGGGGAAANGTMNQKFGGGGGAAGTYSRRLLTAGQIGPSQTVTIGSAGYAGIGARLSNGGRGGQTSLGTLVTAPGGGGGFFTSAVQQGSPGVPGEVGSGDISVRGAPGTAGCYSVGYTGTTYYEAGAGGSSYFGGGAYTVPASSSWAAGTAGQYGGGGSGGLIDTVTGSADGGAGGGGLLVITEFCAA